MLKRAGRTTWSRLALAGLACAAGLVGAAEGLVWADTLSGARADRLFHEASSFIGRSEGREAEGHLTGEWSPIIASHLAEAFVGHALTHPEHAAEASRRVEQLAATLTAPRHNPYKRPLAQVADLGQWGLYLSHLNIVLAAHRRLTGSTRYDALSRRLTRRLAAVSLREPTRIHPSFPEQPRWPADQAATLYSLWLYDQNHGTGLSERPIREWLAVMDHEGRAPTTGLHLSELSRTKWYWRHPRGCALSWTCRYMARFAPEPGLRLWNDYKRLHQRQFLLATAFNEYPRGVSAAMDADSGPLLGSIGSAATALGWGAAAAVGDTPTYLQLTSAFAVADTVLKVARHVDPRVDAVAFSPLALSIRFNSATQVPWFPARREAR